MKEDHNFLEVTNSEIHNFEQKKEKWSWDSGAALQINSAFTRCDTFIENATSLRNQRQGTHQN